MHYLHAIEQRHRVQCEWSQGLGVTHREAARIHIPGLRGFWRQRQVRERGIQLGLGLLFVDFWPFFFLLFHLALVFRFFLPP